MNFLKKALSSAGLYEEPQESTEEKGAVSEKQQPEEKKEQTAKTSISFDLPTTSSVPGQIIGEVNKDIYEKLLKAVEENNIEGNDFLEFMQALSKVGNIAIDEKSKFNLVYSTLATSQGGISKQKVLDSIDFYVGTVLNKENSIFTKELEKSNNDLVLSKEKQVENLNNGIQQKIQQITKLQEEIKEMSQNVAILTAEAADSKYKISKRQADFEATLKYLSDQILGFKPKIEEYIQ